MDEDIFNGDRNTNGHVMKKMDADHLVCEARFLWKYGTRVTSYLYSQTGVYKWYRHCNYVTISHGIFCEAP